MRLTRIACGYFKKYVEREIKKSTGVDKWRPIQGWQEVRKKDWHYDENRPWTDAAKDANSPHINRGKLWLEPMKNWKIFKGDRVEILVGKDKGKQGLVSMVVKERNWCFVEGLHCRFRILNKTPTNPGMMTKEEKPLLVTSEVLLVDPTDLKSTEVEWRYTEEGTPVRVAVRTGRIIPVMNEGDESEDFVKISKYKETEKDTKAKVLEKITFEPKLCTFEQDILEQMGQKEEKERTPSYWY